MRKGCKDTLRWNTNAWRFYVYTVLCDSCFFSGNGYRLMSLMFCFIALNVFGQRFWWMGRGLRWLRDRVEEVHQYRLIFFFILVAHILANKFVNRPDQPSWSQGAFSKCVHDCEWLRSSLNVFVEYFFRCRLERHFSQNAPDKMVQRWFSTLRLRIRNRFGLCWTMLLQLLSSLTRLLKSHKCVRPSLGPQVARLRETPRMKGDREWVGLPGVLAHLSAGTEDLPCWTITPAQRSPPDFQHRDICWTSQKPFGTRGLYGAVCVPGRST